MLFLQHAFSRDSSGVANQCLFLSVCPKFLEEGWTGLRTLDCSKKSGLSIDLIQKCWTCRKQQWLTLSPAGPPQESWTGVRTPAPRISGLTEEGRIGPKNVEVGAAEGRDGRQHPNAGLTLSQEREDGSSPEGAG
ncbi:hypothetical protein DdX_16600 [Ditylenchus destructor]|uniref:Uncharacterized protein n=1 Tax=Ditylenchus destructor TaxID=166010 RepID=A0AAD4MPB7_9BILA|nr:hypothetical protein DdX_16600 [Ditylenchus destructor]